MGAQLESKRGIVNELIVKGKALLENPDKPKFLEAHLNRIIVGWDDTKEKAQTRLTFLQNTKAAWVGYYSGLENIAVEFEKAEEEIKKVKKRFNLQSAFEDLEKRQKIFAATKGTIDGRLNEFDKSLKAIDAWMLGAEESLNNVKTKSDTMTPEDRVSTTME